MGKTFPLLSSSFSFFEDWTVLKAFNLTEGLTEPGLSW
jgi:hypothetical protein